MATTPRAGAGIRRNGVLLPRGPSLAPQKTPTPGAVLSPQGEGVVSPQPPTPALAAMAATVKTLTRAAEKGNEALPACGPSLVPPARVLQGAGQEPCGRGDSLPPPMQASGQWQPQLLLHPELGWGRGT